MSPTFVHLRVHTEYSLIDGMVKVKDLVASTREAGMPAVAVSDNANLYALVKFYNAATSNGIKPIIASDVWVQREGEEPAPLVLIARTDEGYRHLSELISKAYAEGQQAGRATLQPEWLAAKASGLIALGAGQYGDVGRALVAGKLDLAAQYLQQWQEIFAGDYYLELHRTGRTGEDDYIFEAVQLAAANDCPVVATNDVRFLTADEFEAHEVRVCIHDGRTLDDPRRERRYTEQQYLKSPQEMVALFADIPEAIANAVEIARRCNVTVGLGTYYLPEYPIPEDRTIDEFLTEVAKAGLDDRLATILDPADPEFASKRQAYDDRLVFELDIINKMGFPGYFLIVMEFIQWAKDQGIPVGPGRGSGPGSLVAYSLKITDIDPLEYNLLFERFLNPERVSMPDFDIDFCMDGRDRVIAHVTERYGSAAVSQIITFGTMAAKAVVRDVARVQGKPYGLADKLSKLIPFEPGMTLSRALKEEPLLEEFIAESEDAQEIMEMAFQLEGLARNIGKHAGGVVIAPTVLTDFAPTYCDESGGNLMTQFDMVDVEQVGLVKFDFLGLRTLTIIDHAVKSINARRRQQGEADIDIEKIDLEDPAIYVNLKQARTTAVFQLESRGMKDMMKKVKPSRFADIVALVALFRPGPMQLADDFINRKHGREEVDYLHPSLQPVLEDTYGVMLYQEQVMQIAQILAGYTLADADLLRRAMGKKKPEEMAKQREVFVSGATANDVDEKQAGHIFDLMEKFAGYGFNKPHSVCYALVAYQTAWLKHYYPADFMAAVLSADMQTTDKVVINIEECRDMALEILPPDVNQGEFRFVANTPTSIVYGLGAIKGLGEGPVEAIVEQRQAGGSFANLFDFCERVGARVNRRSLEALVGAGALDTLVPDSVLASGDRIGNCRALLAANQDEAVALAEQKARNAEGGVTDLFGEVSLSADDSDDDYHHIAGLKPWSMQDRLARERETLGLYLTGHPIDVYERELRHLAKTRIVDLRVSKDDQTVMGLIVAVRSMKSRRGETMVFATLDDRSARIEISVFSDAMPHDRDLLQKDNVIVVTGSTAVDDFTGGIRVRAVEVMDLETARARALQRLRLSICAREFVPEFSVNLANLLTPYREHNGAGCKVAIDYQGDRARTEVLLGDEWRVRPSDMLLDDLRDHFGAEKIHLDYA